MSPHRIAYLPGDGIGPEVLAVARRVAEAAGLEAEWVEGAVGWSQWTTNGNPLPDATLALLRATDACLFGAITSEPDPVAHAALPAHLQGKVRYRSPIVRIRRELGLAVNVRPARFWPNVPSPLRNAPTDATITVFRENTEDLYADVEAHPVPPPLTEALAAHAGFAPFRSVPPADVALTARVVTRRATHRLLQAAFAYAKAHGEGSVTVAEKANVMRATGGLVLEEARKVAASHPDLRLVVANADALAAALVEHPELHPVIAATNLFGDILSDIAAAVTGGLGLAPSASLGDGYALFEPVHGSAPDIAATGRANPLAAVLSAAMMAEWLGEAAVAERIRAAVRQVLAEGPRTPDLGGTASTADVADAVVAGLPMPARTV